MYVQNLGDGSLSFVMGDRIDRDTSGEILKLYRTIKNSSLLRELSVYDIVPSYCSLTFHFDPLETNCIAVEESLWPLLASSFTEYNESMERSENHLFPVVYKGEDLERVALLTGLAEDQVIRHHQAPIYNVAMIGFRPHFPYLIGLNEKLMTERLDSPRLTVPAGSVGIGGAQTGIYPEDSPGGWNIIGRTDPRLLKNLSPGDSVKFEEVTAL